MTNLVRPALSLNEPNPSGYLRGASVLERLMYRTSESPDGCWLWRGHVDHAGYGSLGSGGRSGPVKKAHRVAYEEFVGPIPEGSTLRQSPWRPTSSDAAMHCAPPEFAPRGTR